MGQLPGTCGGRWHHIRDSGPKTRALSFLLNPPAPPPHLDLDVDVYMDLDVDVDMDVVDSAWGSPPAPAVVGGTTAMTVGQQYARFLLPVGGGVGGVRLPPAPRDVGHPATPCTSEAGDPHPGEVHAQMPPDFRWRVLQIRGFPAWCAQPCCWLRHASPASGAPARPRV